MTAIIKQRLSGLAIPNAGSSTFLLLSEITGKNMSWIIVGPPPYICWTNFHTLSLMMK